jgi:hypothetical protein
MPVSTSSAAAFYRDHPLTALRIALGERSIMRREDIQFPGRKTKVAISKVTFAHVGQAVNLHRLTPGNRAERLGVFAIPLTTDADPVSVATSKELGHTLENLPIGKTLEASIIAENNASEDANNIASVAVG